MFIYLYVGVYMYTGLMAYGSEEDLWKSVLSFYHVGPGTALKPLAVMAGALPAKPSLHSCL